jgi:Ion channel
MVSALLMLQRVVRALQIAAREEAFIPVLSAGVALVVSGTLSYTLAEGWNVVDALYFAVATLTTTSVSDPDLVIQDGWVKLFTILYQIIGIGILVEILRRLGMAFVRVQSESKERP